MLYTPTTANEADTQTLMDTLAALKPGEVCTYAAMSEAIGRNINSARYLLSKAVRRLNKDSGAIFAPVWRVGYQRLASSDAHKLGATARARIRRTAHRSSSMIAAAVDRANEMGDADRRRALSEIAAMNMLAHLATEKLTHALPASDKPRPVAAQMAELLAHIGGKGAQT